MINTYLGAGRLPDRLVQSINPKYKNGPWIAGGAARCLWQNKPINDVDIWCADNIQIMDLVNRLKSAGAVQSFSTPNAISFDYHENDRAWKVQVIVLDRFTSLEKVLDKFDFTCCQIATNGRGHFYMNEQTKEDLDAYRMRAHSFRPDGFVERWAKYTMYGFNMPREELAIYFEKLELVWSLGDGRSLY